MKGSRRRGFSSPEGLCTVAALGIVLAVFIPVVIRTYELVQAKRAAAGGVLSGSELARTLGGAFGTLTVGVLAVALVLAGFAIWAQAMVWLWPRLTRAAVDLRDHRIDRTDRQGEGRS